MSRPLTNACTMHMPELHQTRPVAAVHAELYCAWCCIRLTAVPDSPCYFGGRYYHPSCLVPSQRPG